MSVGLGIFLAAVVLVGLPVSLTVGVGIFLWRHSYGWRLHCGLG